MQERALSNALTNIVHKLWSDQLWILTQTKHFDYIIRLLVWHFLKKNNGEPTCIISISISIKYYINIIQTTFSLHANHNKHIIDTLHKRDTSMLREQKCTKLQAENDDFIVREISAD